MGKHKTKKGMERPLFIILLSLAVLLVTGLAAGLTTSETKIKSDGSVKYDSTVTYTPAVGGGTTVTSLDNKGTVAKPGGGAGFTFTITSNQELGGVATTQRTRSTVDLTTQGSTIYEKTDTHTDFATKKTSIFNADSCVENVCSTVPGRNGTVALSSTTTNQKQSAAAATGECLTTTPVAGRPDSCFSRLFTDAQNSNQTAGTGFTSYLQKHITYTNALDFGDQEAITTSGLSVPATTTTTGTGFLTRTTTKDGGATNRIMSTLTGRAAPTSITTANADGSTTTVATTTDDNTLITTTVTTTTHPADLGAIPPIVGSPTTVTTTTAGPGNAATKVRK